MKIINGSVLVGIVIASAIIYWLRPLNTAAAALVVLLSVGFCSLYPALIQKRKRKEK